MTSQRELYTQDALPIFQNRMYDSVEAARNCPRGDMRLVEDMATGLVHNADFRPEVMDYDAHYQNEQGVSSLFRAHMDGIADLVERVMGRTGLVEVGCGKGTFLEMLLARGVEVVGYDPTYEGDNPIVRREYFTEDLGITGDGLILRHVLEHIPDPVSFLQRLAAANGNRGLIYIEVPCLDWICQHRAWFDIFYEHVNYFRLTDFDRIFGRVVHSARAFGGQYLTVVADLSTLRVPEKKVLPIKGLWWFGAGRRRASSSPSCANGPAGQWTGSSISTRPNKAAICQRQGFGFNPLPKAWPILPPAARFTS
jgi:SAM-dependent methyltransferase